MSSVPYRKKIVVIVLGYGCRLFDAMRGYLSAAGRFAYHPRVEAVITTGAETNRRTAPGVSEAQMMAAYLRDYLGGSFPIFEETTSVTTKQNLVGARRIMAKQGLEGAEPVIFCDQARMLKARLLARLILGRWPTMMPYPLTTNRAEYRKQLFIATPLSLLAYFIPFLERRELAHRERLMNQS